MTPPTGSAMDGGVLGRILRRMTGRVSTATAVVGAVSTVANAAAKAYPLPETSSSLTLMLRQDIEIGWTATPGKQDSGVWNFFLKWYHGRPQSPCFVMNHKHGSQMVRRKDILRYEIKYWNQ